MHDPVVIIWRVSPTARLIDVQASPDGSPQLLEREEVDERVLDSEQALLEYLKSGSNEHVAVPRQLAHDILGWDL